jgi:hypothetical protein
MVLACKDGAEFINICNVNSKHSLPSSEVDFAFYSDVE